MHNFNEQFADQLAVNDTATYEGIYQLIASRTLREAEDPTYVRDFSDEYLLSKVGKQKLYFMKTKDMGPSFVIMTVWSDELDSLQAELADHIFEPAVAGSKLPKYTHKDFIEPKE